VPKIKARLLLQYGGLDERVNAGIPAFEAALKAAGVKYQLFVYEGAQHAFNNDTAPTRYNEAGCKTGLGKDLATVQGNYCLKSYNCLIIVIFLM
jgi:carboxymethylenebutenolidase